MTQPILQVIQSQSEHGHRTVSVFFERGCRLCRQQLAGHSRPDERDQHRREQRRDLLSLRDPRVFETQSSRLEGGM